MVRFLRRSYRQNNQILKMMNTDLQIENDTACFLLIDVPLSLQDAVRGLYYTRLDLGFV